MKKKLLLLIAFLGILFYSFYWTKCSGVKRNTRQALEVYSASAERIVFSGYTQGTYYRVVYYANDTIVTRKDIENVFENFLLTASIYDKNSLISKINRNGPTELNDDFVVIFNRAKEISSLTEGAFDVTVGNLVNAWGFGPKAGTDLTPEQVQLLRKNVGYDNVDIVNGQVVKKDKEIELNFNAIAKGYSADLVSRFLRQNKIENFLVNVGGEICASGKKADGSPWVVGVEQPTADADDEAQMQTIIELTDKSLATSGTYRRYREEDGVRYSHTVDPRTGYPVSHTLLSATVIADDCMTADALATAFMVLGKDEAMKFLEAHPQYEGYFISSDTDDEFKVTYTKGFEKYIRNQQNVQVFR